MKIPKLFTSQGFGLWLKSMTTREFCKLSGVKEPTVSEGANGFFRVDAVKLRLRDDWDKKLTGILKKEMFVNEIEKPEKKVILNRVEYFNGLIKYRLNYEYGGAMECRSHTLNDLAEATKGQLELQNVEL